ncbi:hypothetical protein RI054_31g123650 [Pseudoscourfieldia marina]
MYDEGEFIADSSMAPSTVLEFCRNSKWQDAVRRLNSHPNEAKQKNKDGDLPLHWAVANNAPVEVVSKLIDAYRDGVQVKNNNGNLPLHYAANYNAPVEVISKLLDAYRDGAQVKNNDGNLPLHLAAANDASVEVISKLLDAYPDGAQVKNNDSSLPLHYAAYYNAPVEVISKLLDAYPDGAQVKDNDGALPLHLAANYNAPVEVISKLLDAYRDGAQVKDNDGDLPLHWAAYYNASVEVISKLLDAHRVHLHAPNDLRLQEHMASASIAILKRDAHPIKDLLNQGVDLGKFADGVMHPLHLAARLAMPFVTKRFVNKFPGLCSATFENQNALHIACSCTPNRDLGINASDIKDTVKALIQAGIGVDSTTNDGCSMTPLLYASRDGCVESVRELIDAGADLKANKCALGETALHKAVSRGDANVDMVRVLLCAMPDAQDAQDAQGLTARDVAQEEGYQELVKVIDANASPNLGEKKQKVTLNASSNAQLASTSSEPLPYFQRAFTLLMRAKSGDGDTSAIDSAMQNLRRNCGELEGAVAIPSNPSPKDVSDIAAMICAFLST